ncbi:MAG: sulfite exporter TauE/SafE family protein, partial [Imperialibacter sp.]
LYLLSVHLPKNSFIGTAAWFFMVLNWFKLPFHIFSWHTITVDSFLFDLVTLPAIGLGALIGVAIIKEIPEKQYRWFIIAMTVVAAFGMLL